MALEIWPREAHNGKHVWTANGAMWPLAFSGLQCVMQDACEKEIIYIYIFIYAMHILIHLIYHGQGYEYFSKNRGLDSGQNVSWAIYKWHLVGCQLGRSEGWHKPPATILAPWPSLKGRAPGQHLVAAGEKVLQVSQIPGFRPPKNKITPYSAVNMHLSFVSMVSCGASVGLFWCISQSPYLYNHYQLLHIPEVPKPDLYTIICECWLSAAPTAIFTVRPRILSAFLEDDFL